jgi:hypothetical protein
MANDSWMQQVAAMHAQRVQHETAQRVQEIQEGYGHAIRECQEAAQRGDWETAELCYTDALEHARDWQYYNPPQPPQLDPRLVDFAKKNSQFLERYGERAFQALDAAHQYMTRPRNLSTNDPRYTGMGWKPEYVFSPTYFEKLKDLLEMHGEKFLGVKFDRNEEALTPNEAAKISGLSPKAYNRALQQVASQGRLGTQRK